MSGGALFRGVMNEENIKREKRRRRRVRNQILAYITLVIFMAVVLAAAYFGAVRAVKYIKNYNNKVSEAIAEAESNASAVLESETAGEPETIQALQEIQEKEAAPPEPEADPLGELADALLQDMTLEEMAAGMFMITPEALTGVRNVVKAGDGTKSAILEKPVGGIIYSPKNFRTGEQFKEMLGNTKDFAKYPLFMAVEAECGAKLSFGLSDTKKASEFAGADDAKEAYDSIAKTLASYGINMNITSTAGISADLAAAAVQAMHENGVSAALQKLPGDDTPCSLSGIVITEISRGDLGFDGLIISAALDDASITQRYTPEEAAVAAIEAGADMLYKPADFEAAYNGVLKAVEEGRITRERIYESMRRIYMVKYILL